MKRAVMTNKLGQTAPSYSQFLYLWEQRTLFIGSLNDPLNISTGASTLMFALDKPIKFKTSQMSKPLECRSLLLPAGTAVTIDTQGGMIANCTLDPLGKDLHILSKLMEHQCGSGYYQLRNEQVQIKKFRAICTAPFKSHEIIASFVDILSVKNKKLPTNIIDRRIEQIIELIQSTISENLSLSELADAANISPSRLTQLFKEQTGIPVRRYRLWYRLYITAFKIGQGMNLTDAAAVAGFTDSPHFIRTSRSMLGMKPSYISQMKIILPGSVQTKFVSAMK